MKVSVAIFAIAAADDRKVPPRRPEQRLSRLNQFSAEWLNANLPNLPSKDAWIAKFETNASRMMRAYERENCGYFDPTNLPHGGPDPNPHLRPNLKPRKTLRKRREADSDDYEADDGTLLRYDRENPLTGIRQITTGYRKWAQRFINECGGQRKFKYQVNRMRSWFDKLGKHYIATQD
jgi:hypothetical protein